MEAVNREKNRTQDILPADRHRPYLQTRVTGTNDYINAVFLDVRTTRTLIEHVLPVYCDCLLLLFRVTRVATRTS